MMVSIQPDHRLRIAGLFERKQDLPHDLWRHAQRYLAQVPGCIFTRFDLDTQRDQVAAWRPQGVVTHCIDPSHLDALRPMGIPVVNTSTTLPRTWAPRVSPDNGATGFLAAKHLLGKGHPQFAFIGKVAPCYARERLAGCRKAVEEAGAELRIFEADPPDQMVVADLDLVNTPDPLSLFLQSLPARTAIITDDDSSALSVLEVLHALGIDARVRFALISCHDRESPANPSLTAVRQAEQRWGYEAARLVVRMVRGECPREVADLLIPPSGVTERESTRGLASDDPILRAAVAFIADHADQNIGVEQVVEAVPLGRRALERRFLAELGRTVLQEIHRVHIVRAQALLVETDICMEAVAAEAGLADAKHLRRLFSGMMGITPAAFRKSHRTT